MKLLSKTLLCAYLLVLLWLTLFKLSFDIYSILLHHQTRSLNLVPFADYSRDGLREMVANLVVFIPFGVLLGVELKQVSFGRKLALVCMFSLAVEAVQFAFSIGVTDISDVIANTSGGLVGLVLYDAAKKLFNNKRLDDLVVVSGMVLLVALVLYRILILQVRY